MKSFPLQFSHRVDLADEGMIQGRCRPGFSKQSSSETLIFLFVPGDKLQGHLSSQQTVFSQIDLSHGSLAQFLHNPVTGDIRLRLLDFGYESIASPGYGLDDLLLVWTIVKGLAQGRNRIGQNLIGDKGIRPHGLDNALFG